MIKDIDIKKTTIGDIVANNFSTSKVFTSYGIDFCCNGGDTFETASKKANVDPSIVLEALAQQEAAPSKGGGIPFNLWPKDLLIDYVLKIHHRGIRTNGPEISELFTKVIRAHSANHPELFELQKLFLESLAALEFHLRKEDNMLYPYLYKLYDAVSQNEPIESFHGGSVSNPISVMMQEHDTEGVRYRQIRELSNNLTPPDDACNSYKMLYLMLADFEEALHEHIHLENNIIFPWAIEVESRG